MESGNPSSTGLYLLVSPRAYLPRSLHDTGSIHLTVTTSRVKIDLTHVLGDKIGLVKQTQPYRYPPTVLVVKQQIFP